MINLVENGVATNHTDSEEVGWIIICNIDTEQVPCKSIYEERLANVNYGVGGKFWMVRLMVNHLDTSVKTYKEETESTLFKD